MNHTKFVNEAEITDPSQVDIWIRENLAVNNNTPITVQLNPDFTVRLIDIGKKLSQADKTKLLTKFPELEGKETEE